MFINIVNRNYSYTPPVVLSNKSCLRIWPNQLFCRLLRVYIISLCVSVICSNNDWNCLKFLVSDCSNFQLYVSWGKRRSLICVQTFVVAKQVRIADDFTRRLIENAARCGLTVHRHVPEDGNCFFSLHSGPAHASQRIRHITIYSALSVGVIYATVGTYKTSVMLSC